jgi:hypothetical protein
MSGDPYRWPSSALELERLQTELAERWGTAPRCPVPAGRPLRTAGVFVAFGAGPRGREAAWAAAVVMEAGRVLATAVVRGRANAPYEPGHLALQRGPLLELAVRKLEVHPDVLLVNATGRDHPRRAGLALNLGRGVNKLDRAVDLRRCRDREEPVRLRPCSRSSCIASYAGSSACSSDWASVTGSWRLPCCAISCVF